ncbi:unnamed protein product [Cuscuta europaea]|uniref:Axial regulator YABBY 2 n=1 Tax=Cuscuta europaea TaxID=41803 RepID=A0A9P1E228_CUSEU|nr:unnamed protein product [Cuscuta europaea]
MDISFCSLERVGYVQCNFCSTVLAVSVPASSSMFSFVTVRCGHCSNLLSVAMTSNFLPPLPLQDIIQKQKWNKEDESGSTSSKLNKSTAIGPSEQPRLSHIRPPERRHRVPSAYNRFIKEEIQRIKASNPDISHREAFSTAAKNWAHFPHIHFGLNLDNKQAQLDHSVGGEGLQKSIGLC